MLVRAAGASGAVVQVQDVKRGPVIKSRTARVRGGGGVQRLRETAPSR